jgi:hypothetical protein
MRSNRCLARSLLLRACVTPGAIALDASNVYFVTLTAVVRAPK